MFRFNTVGIAALLFAFVANVASAQVTSQTSGRDSLWNGALIGAGAGLASTAALDAVFCDNGFGGCDFPWTAALTLGAIGAATGAGIDFLIGRSSNTRTTLRVSPIVGRARRGVVMSLVLPGRGSLPRKTASGFRGPDSRGHRSPRSP